MVDGRAPNGPARPGIPPAIPLAATPACKHGAVDNIVVPIFEYTVHASRPPRKDAQRLRMTHGWISKRAVGQPERRVGAGELLEPLRHINVAMGGPVGRMKDFELLGNRNVGECHGKHCKNREVSECVPVLDNLSPHAKRTDYAYSFDL